MDRKIFKAENNSRMPAGDALSACRFRFMLVIMKSAISSNVGHWSNDDAKTD